MPRRQRGRPARCRVGRVSVFPHHGAWWAYYRECGKAVRRKIAATQTDAMQIAAQINAQLATAAPTLLAFTPIDIPALRQRFLEHHENVLRSSIGTIRRYRAATQHLENYAGARGSLPQCHTLRPAEFVAYLRDVKVAPNGHPNSARRHLRDKGIRFILETCRAMYTFAAKQRHLPPYTANIFAELPLDRMRNDTAKAVFVFDSDSELAFFRAADSWAFPLHFTLAKTGLRVGELVHLLVEEVDLVTGWLRVCNKVLLGWRIKTGNERVVPLLPEVVAVLRRAIGCRLAGPVFLRPKFTNGTLPSVVASRQQLETICAERQREKGAGLTRMEMLRIARGVWRDAGAVKADVVRSSFMRLMQSIGRPEATCPKSWRHTFATLLQDANVDPLIRQLTLGHRPVASAGLGMTGIYTHTRPETQRQQIEQALRLWPNSLQLACERTQGGVS